MLRFLSFMTVVVALCTPVVNASAENIMTPDEFVAWTDKNIKRLELVIEQTIKFGDSACKRLAAEDQRAACKAAYEMLVALRKWEIAELKLLRSSTHLPAPLPYNIQRRILDPANFERRRNEDDQIANHVYSVFPVSPSNKR